MGNSLLGATLRRSAVISAGTTAALGAAAIVFAVLPAAAGAAQSVTTYAELTTEVAAGHDVTLDADITGTTTLTVSTRRPVSIDLAGHSLKINASAAGIAVPAGAKLVVTDPPNVGEGSLQVSAGPQHAGIEVAPTATFLLNGGEGTTLVATGGTNGAGIGGGAGKDGGTVVIGQGKVTATGGTNGAGIGGGANGDAGSLLVKVGQVTATGGIGGAGIGGGSKGAGGPVTVRNGFVSATGGSGAAGVGAGTGGAATDPTTDPTSVDVQERGVLSTVGSPAITLGSFTNAGIVQVLDDSSLPVPAGVTGENSGLIRLRGTITGTGTIHNSGTILPTPIGRVSDDRVTDDGQGPAGTTLLVSEHNYTIPFDLRGQGGTTPDTMHVYAKDIATAKQTLPDVPAAPGYTCEAGWWTAASGGTRVIETTLLSTVTAYGPSTLTLYRHCTVVNYTVAFDPQGGSPTPATQTVAGGAHATQPAAPIKTDQTFTGWYTTPSGNVQWNFASDVVTHDITLYAQYTATTSPPPGSGIGGVSTSTNGSGTNGSGIAGVSTSLADTGSRTLGLLQLAGLLLLSGAGLALAGRRRRSTGR